MSKKTNNMANKKASHSPNLFKANLINVPLIYDMILGLLFMLLIIFKGLETGKN